MKTALDFDTLRRKFTKKNSILYVHSKDLAQRYGEADFDLSSYANNPDRDFEEKLPLKNCPSDPNAYIEIYIKAKVLEPLSPMKTPSGYKGMSIIEEKENDADPKEEFEKKEKKFLRDIELREEELEQTEEVLRSKQEELQYV